MIQLLGILVVALLLYLGQKTVYQKVWHKNLRVRLSFQEEGIWEGQESTLSEIIENQKKLPLTMLKVKFQTDRHLLQTPKVPAPQISFTEMIFFRSAL